MVPPGETDPHSTAAPRYRISTYPGYELHFDSAVSRSRDDENGFSLYSRRSMPVASRASAELALEGEALMT
jgi:hypothetical protein